jgi:hypothetical protein
MANKTGSGFWYFTTKEISAKELKALPDTLLSSGFINSDAARKMREMFKVGVPPCIRVNKHDSGSIADVGSSSSLGTYSDAYLNNGLGERVDPRVFLSYNEG